jgi:predicted SAM-dependent methyltransferase
MKLHLGCNNRYLDGWTNVDIMPGDGVDIVSSAHELTDIEDDSVDEILAEHLIEHLTFYEANRALAEWYRVLKPGGKLTVEAPDLFALCQAFVEANDYQRFQSNHGSWAIIQHIYGNQTGRSSEEKLSQTHKSGYTWTRLCDMLYGVGFAYVEHGDPVKNTPGAHVFRLVAAKEGK